MSQLDRRVDHYITNAEPFAQPILKAVRKWIRRGCPEVVEAIKWNFPHFDYQGPLCGMAAFKQHCSVGFWKGELVLGKKAGEEGGMGHFGKVTKLADLPSANQFVDYVRKAAELNRAGIKKPSVPPKPKKRLVVPKDLAASLKKNKKAAATFDRFSYSHRKEYLEWIEEAKRAETRAERIRTAVAWMAEGKSRNWKYLRRKEARGGG